MSSYASADVLCPFYRRDDPKTSSLTCEGALPGSSVKSHLGSRDGLQEVLRKYCCRDYTACPWYHIVGYKWEEPGK